MFDEFDDLVKFLDRAIKSLNTPRSEYLTFTEVSGCDVSEICKN